MYRRYEHHFRDMCIRYRYVNQYNICLFACTELEPKFEPPKVIVILHKHDNKDSTPSSPKGSANQVGLCPLPQRI